MLPYHTAMSVSTRKAVKILDGAVTPKMSVHRATPFGALIKYTYIMHDCEDVIWVYVDQILSCIYSYLYFTQSTEKHLSTYS